jgi:UDP-N-acetylmuramyl pentapeptide synthase
MQKGLKNLARQLVLGLLSYLARRRLPRNAEIIGITGSVGKTTTKEAAVKILGSHYRILANQKSFNSEFGVPLTLLSEESGYSSPLAWLGILARAVGKSCTKIPAEKIVLELGVDAPGDMSKLLEIVQPQIGVFLAVAPVHLAAGQFESIEAIAAEKGKLIASLPESGTAIWNADDPLVAKVSSAARKISFGIENPADLQATAIQENLAGLSAQLTFQDKTAELKIPILGKHNLYPLLAATAIGLASGLSLQECVAALADFHLPPGRGNLLRGINGSQIIDASYNSNPASLAATLASLKSLPVAGRRIALLGQMNELGAESPKLHRELGARAAEYADEVIGVFGDARLFVEAATVAGKLGKFFATATEAGAYLKEQLKPGDLVLAKGSQNNVRVEQAVAELLADPADKKLLPRQEKFWQEN